jgi:hypothetical protein
MFESQVFEAMGDFISKDYFYKYAMPCLSKVSPEKDVEKKYVGFIELISLVNRTFTDSSRNESEAPWRPAASFPSWGNLLTC